MISVVILTKNEEKNILDCLESVSWADEIIVIDDYSQDLTEAVVKHFAVNKKTHFFKRRLEEDFASQRNYGLSKAKYDWILFVDADERITNPLREEINTILINSKNNTKSNGFYIPRKDVIWGKTLRHGETGNIKLLRFAKKNSGKWIGKVHETWEVKDNVGEFDNYILHYPHQTISEFLKEINFYTTIRAKELFNNKVRVSVKEIIFYPKLKFIVNYFYKLGFLDGIEGLIYAIIMSLHSFLVRAKLWILWEKN
jgi:glycosyltransferase involved in cell wall biosynthesis